MSTAFQVGGSGLLWVLGCGVSGQWTMAAVFAVGHFLFWQNHVLEVKVNRLLDERGILVTKTEINK